MLIMDYDKPLDDGTALLVIGSIDGKYARFWYRDAVGNALSSTVVWGDYNKEWSYQDQLSAPELKDMARKLAGHLGIIGSVVVMERSAGGHCEFEV